jgi:hypothetical protein
MIIVLAIGMIGCSDINVEHRPTDYRIKQDGGPLQILVIDSCEYLYGAWGHATVLTHKGNCSNPIHKYDEPNEIAKETK